jgi:hydrogenase maturation factor
MHYLDKLIQGANFNINHDNIKVDEEVERFSIANDLDPLESQYMFIICTYRNDKALKSARQLLARIIGKAKQELDTKSVEEVNRPGTPEDGGHHARYIEPK